MRECRKDFTVKIGTFFESSHVPLHEWLLVKPAPQKPKDVKASTPIEAES